MIFGFKLDPGDLLVFKKNREVMGTFFKAGESVPADWPLWLKLKLLRRGVIQIENPVKNAKKTLSIARKQTKEWVEEKKEQLAEEAVMIAAEKIIEVLGETEEPEEPEEKPSRGRPKGRK